MKIAVLACKTIEDEVMYAESIVKSGYDIYTIESQHNHPDKFRVAIQSELDKLNGYRRVLLAFGFCGNTVAGLKTHSFEMIIPRVDDCISLMLGSRKKREEVCKDHECIFLTKGWLDSEANIWSEYQHALKKYGPQRAKKVMKMLYSHTDMLSLIDTKAYNINEIMDKSQQIAATFELEFNIIPGTTVYIKNLLTRPWDEKKFVVIPPDSVVSIEQLTYYQQNDVKII